MEPQFLVTNTTGAMIVITTLDGYELVIGATDIDLYGDQQGNFAKSDITDNKELQALLESGDITAKNENGDAVTNIITPSINSRAITTQSTITPSTGDFLLVSDTSDSGNLKKVDVSNFVNPSTEASSSSTITRSSTAYGLIAGMSITPVAGNYMVYFSSSVENNNSDGQTYVAIHVGGAINKNSERSARNNHSKQKYSTKPISTQTKVTVNGSQVITAQWKHLNGGIATMYRRTINIIKVL